MKKVLLRTLFLVICLQCMTACKQDTGTATPHPETSSPARWTLGNSTTAQEIENRFTEKSCKMGQITSPDIPNLFVGEKEFPSPDGKNMMKLTMDYDPEYPPDSRGRFDSFFMKIFLNGKLVFADWEVETEHEEVVWINNETVVFFNYYVFSLRDQKIKRIDFSKLAKLKNNATVYGEHSAKAIYDQGEEGLMQIESSSISPDKKYILYGCNRFEDKVADCDLIAQYDIEGESFRILNEVPLPQSEDSTQNGSTLVWVEDGKVVRSTTGVDAWRCLELELATGKTTTIPDVIVGDMTSDRKHWVKEVLDQKTDQVTTILCSADGTEYQLYKEKNGVVRTVSSMIDIWRCMLRMMIQ